MAETIDRLVEEQALRHSGILGRGDGMGNSLYAMDYALLPPEAQRTIQLIINGGPFPYPQDGTPFGNRFGDLPSRGDCLSPGNRRDSVEAVVIPGSSTLTIVYLPAIAGTPLKRFSAATLRCCWWSFISRQSPGLR